MLKLGAASRRGLIWVTHCALAKMGQPNYSPVVKGSVLLRLSESWLLEVAGILCYQSFFPVTGSSMVT